MSRPPFSPTRRFVLGGLLAGAATPLWAEAPATSLLPRRRGDGGAVRAQPQSAGQLVEAAKLGGAVGFIVADAVTGAVIEARDADQAMPPASVLKSVTAAFALDRLGPVHRFQTRVLRRGPVVQGVVQGDLILAGGGDPVLDTDMLGDLAAKLAAQGIRGATGRLLVWGGALPLLPRIDGEQPDFVGYNPAVAGLNLNFNRVHFEWRRAGADWRLTMDARAERFVPEVHMASVRIATRARPLFTYEGDGGADRWTVASEALGKGGARWLPVRHPALYAGDVFRTLVAAQGIALPAPEVIESLPDGAELLARHDSPVLEGILKDMLKHSTNLTAEVAGMSASQAASLRASALAMQEWARLRHGMSAHFVDHSGLGGQSRISPADMVRLLGDVQASALPGLLKNHGMRDDKGQIIKGHPVQVHAKTGTLNFVSSLAGYIAPPGGRRLAFAIFAADTARRAALPPEAREQPAGGLDYQKRARRLQAALITRWATLHG
ncbi:MAG: D-alanyl-D-alanine carboxypeptidase/D-alanyl-D-alanine-endopeptidase [Rhodobacterales bacterium 65-51]|uniref:D-alanyl-D-alanine carboxypeptidase/D-alanyl-D-alanine endopeptidase n=1 Tax=uncultured Gemmobacter sp. TaxID=1095917 RepID=UPI0009631198|nr:D-alanyl-D-alanine carboxypeptidase/D-alanyl-D-alanine-endopeptidase [uncultured Gemmobacter sp.]OJY30153.1 MAG: D-alanyl-D-alanine carboxypeptidase/D-alanyl-D-alanine-endopeptidase [Rhodobacterales bacterium 65-51]